jgi:hypothetical protein
LTTSAASSAIVVANTGTVTTITAVAINGKPMVGTKSTITAGSYSPSPTGRSYQWQRCDSSGNNCVPISGATQSAYTPVPADAGKKLRVVETVTTVNGNGGSTSAASPLTVKGNFIMNQRLAILGHPKHGVVSHIRHATYTPDPTTITYSWLRCNSVSDRSCVVIPRAKSDTYKPVAADVGKRLRVVETVSGSGYNTYNFSSAASSIVT